MKPEISQNFGDFSQAWENFGEMAQKTRNYRIVFYYSFPQNLPMVDKRFPENRVVGLFSFTIVKLRISDSKKLKVGISSKNRYALQQQCLQMSYKYALGEMVNPFLYLTKEISLNSHFNLRLNLHQCTNADILSNYCLNICK